LCDNKNLPDAINAVRKQTLPFATFVDEGNLTVLKVYGKTVSVSV